MSWDMVVERVDNGFVASYLEEVDGEFEERRSCFEGKDDDVEAFQRLLVFVTDYFGMTGSKHDKKRITITTGEPEGGGCGDGQVHYIGKRNGEDG